ncbi:MAG TPA: LamG-like jellyroll fold domain-containing protein [Candidatus Limnocylindrales bacterium]
MAVAFALTVAVPQRVETGDNGGFPLSWLWSWAAKPAWAGSASAFVGRPVQMRGNGLERGHYVPAGQTRAGGGQGRAPEVVPEGLKPYAPHDPNVGEGAAGRSTRGFEASSSRRAQRGADAATEVFDNADGSVTRRLSGGRVNYRGADGNWYPIDTRLISKADGRWHMGANEIQVSFAGGRTADVPSGATVGQLAKAPTRMASLTLPSGQSVAYDLSGASLTEPVVREGTATYANVMRDTDLELVATDGGFKETMILRSPQAPNRWTFPLELKGLTPRMTEAGDVELVDAEGAVRVWLPVGYMQDSKVDPVSGAPAESTNLRYELVGNELHVTADPAWLNDPARVYPVRADPTATTWTTGDVFVDNNATGPDHNGDNLPVGTWDSAATKTRSFIHFDEFDDNGFVGRRITAANLKLYLTWTYSCGVFRAVNVHAATQAWTVAGLDAGSYPGPTISSAIGSWTGSDYSVACTNTAGNRSVGKWITVPLNVTTFDNWAKGGSNLGLALTASETDNNAWKRFTSANYSSGQYRPHLELTYAANVAPQLDSRYPANNFVAASLTPQLVARAHDPDSWPNTGLQYKFRVYNDAGTTLVTESALGGATWTVPPGKLNWGKTYLYTVQVYDKAAYSAIYPAYAFSTPVPQPQLTSRLAQNADKGFDPSIGNYTTSATDASVETVGPELEIVRSYNSLDLRSRGAFGRGWASIADTAATEVKDAAGGLQTVVITYPDGQDVAFGREANGTFAAPSGRHATLAGTTGAYTFTDKDSTVYRFNASGKVAAITDANGLALTFTYDASGQLSAVTSASGRSLSFTWSTPAGSNYPHIATVKTDPVVAGDAASALTWSYTYDNDNLTKVCDPTVTACTAYSYTWISQHANAMQNLGPYSYWRLNEAPGEAMARSSMQANAGVDNGVYNNVTLGQPPAFGHSTSTSASFDGTSSYVQLPGKLITDGPFQSISLWFKTTGSGVLAGTQNKPVTETPATYHPNLYVGTDGKLYGQFWSGAVEPMASPAAVNDGQWHHAAVTADATSQALYLDGSKIGTLAKPLVAVNPEMSYAFLGTARWTNRPAVTGDYGYFNGSISDAAFFTTALSAQAVADMQHTGTWVRSALTKITRPSGGVSASISYDMSTGRVASVTDENGGVWTVRAPKIEGSSDVYAASVLGGKPAEYWRLGDVPGDSDTVNEVKGGTASYNEFVTLGAPGPFADATAARFNGTTSEVRNPAPSLDTSKNFSMSAWVRLTDDTRHQRVVSVIGNRTSGVWLGFNKDVKKWQVTMYQSDVDAPASNRASSTAVAALNTWTQLTATHDATSRALKLYVNGVLQETVTVGGTKWRAANALVLGHDIYAGATSNWLKGEVAEVATFHGILTPAQIAVQYAASKQSAPVAITKVAGGVASIVMPVATMGVTDPGGKEISYSYDIINGYRVVAQTDALGNTTKFGYDVGGYSSLTYDARGVLTEEIQDVRGNTIQSITCQDQAGRKCSSVYYTYFPDATTSVLTPDARNDVMLTMRDGRSASATDNAFLTTYAYDAKGNQTEVTEPLGRKTTTTYNGQGLPVRVVSPGGVADTIEYNAAGDVVRSVDGLGKANAYTYDGVGRIVTETETSNAYPGGLTTRYTFDARGKVLTQTEPAITNRVTGAIHTSVTTSAYNADGLVTSQAVADTTGGDAPRSTLTSYNAYGQVATETDPKGDVTRYEYDAYGNMVKETEPDGGVVVNTFDAEGSLLTTRIVGWTGDPNNPSAPTDLVTTSNAYDPNGRLASETDAQGMTTLFTYTDNGLEAKVVSTDGTNSFVVEDNTYDAAGNLIKQVTDNGATTTTFTYDAAGRQLTSTLDPNGLKRTTTHAYSPDDEVLTSTETDAAGAVVGFTEHLYDAEGNPIAETVYATNALSPVGRWKLADLKDSSGNSKLSVTGAVTWVTSPRTGAVFDGASALSTTGPVLDTGRSFTVTAWANPAEGSRNRGVVSQEGARESGFYLKYDQVAGGKWSFVMYNADDQASPNTYATSTTVAPLNTWSHIAAVYDGPAKTLRLYVNGVLQTTKALNAAHVPWTSYGPLDIGRLKYHGNLTDHWQGQIGDVQTYQKALSATEITSIHAGTGPAADAGVLRTSHVLDSRGLPLNETDPMGEVTDYWHDEESRIVQTVGPAVPAEVAGGAPVMSRPVTTVGYDTFGDVVETRDPNGNVTVVGYDAAGQTLSTTQPGYTPPGSSTPITPVTRNEYDTAGNLTASVDELGKRNTYGYDQLGRLAKHTAPNGGVTTYAYDLTDNLLTSTDPNGVVNTSTYDHLGRVATATHVVRQNGGANFTTTYTYDNAGNVAQVRTPAGVTQSFTYNAADEVLTATDGAGGVTRYTYDGSGRLVKKQLPDNTYRTVTYDMVDRALSQSAYNASGALLTTESNRYDAGGNVIETTDARGTKNTFTYDATGAVLTARQPVSATDAIVTTFGYDLMGNRTRFTDGRGGRFISTYNKWNLLESHIEPPTAAHPNAADRTFTTVYDAAGRAVTQLQPGGARITTGYDDLGRVTRQTGSGAEVTTADRVFGYDPGGRLTSMSGTGGTNTVSYDDRGLVLSLTGPSGNSSFAYNPDGEMTSRTDVAGTTTYTYDTAGRIKTVVNAAQQVNASLNYNTASLVDRITYNTNGNYRAFSYDALHRPTLDELKTPAGASIAKTTYGWDPNGNETSKATTGFAGASANTYTYDLADRLITWNSTGYGYDKSGNRTSNGAQVFRYDERNRLIDEGNGTTYTYTARGTLRQTTVGTTNLATEADAFGQVTRQYATAAGWHDYTYDGLGRVMRPGFAYTGLGNHLAADGTATYTRDPEGDLMGVATDAAKTLAWTDFHTDVVGQFTATGTALNGSTSYDPLGRILATSGMIGNLGYQSEWTDAFTGRVNMLSRWYNTNTGQFDTRDTASNGPVPDSINANRYQYGDGNPLTVTDPTGHWGWNPFKAVKKAVSKVYHATTSFVSRSYSYARHYSSYAYSYAKSKVSHAVRTVKKKYHAAKSYVKKKIRKAVHYVKKKYKAAKSWVKKKYNSAKKWVKKKVKAAKKWVSKKYHSAKKYLKKKYNQAKQLGKKVISKAKRVVKKAVNTVKDAAKKTAKWVKDHKAEIAGFVVGAVVGIGCGALIGWTGVGAVACGALAGAAGSLVTGAMNGHRGWDLVKDALVGGTIGALTGGLFSVGGAALGAGVRSAISGTGIRSALGAAGRAGAGAARSIGSGLASAGRGAVYAATNPVKKLFGRGMVDLYHGTSKAGAAAIRRGGINVHFGRGDADFGQGFYLTKLKSQAKEWAEHGRSPADAEVMHYRVPQRELANLDTKQFPASGGSDWESLVMQHRSLGRGSTSPPLHSYEAVEGPMLYNPDEFLSGQPPSVGGHQISFHTDRAGSMLDNYLQ